MKLKNIVHYVHHKIKNYSDLKKLMIKFCSEHSTYFKRNHTSSNHLHLFT